MSKVIEIRDLVKRYKDVTAVNGLSLEVEQGCCLGMLGPNGAGKTTTLEILEGLKEPTTGEVRLFGVTWREARREIRRRIGVQLQETRFAERSSVAEILRIFRSFYASGLSVDEALGLVQLEAKRDQWVVNLSGGQHQRLALAVALMGAPELLFLDEPTTGLDPQSRRALWDIIESLKKRGQTIILTSHYMEEAEVLCDRVAVVDHGKVVADGSPSELIALIGGYHRLIVHPLTPVAPEVYSEVAGVHEVTPKGDGAILAIENTHEVLPAVLSHLSARGIGLREVSVHRPTLDDVFLSLTGRSLREGPPQPEKEGDAAA